jgi:hypothetical protein
MTYYHLLSSNQNKSFHNISGVQRYNTSGQNMKLLSEGEKEDHDDYNTCEDRRQQIEYLYMLFRRQNEYLPKKQLQVEVE